MLIKIFLIIIMLWYPGSILNFCICYILKYLTHLTVIALRPEHGSVFMLLLGSRTTDKAVIAPHKDSAL